MDYPAIIDRLEADLRQYRVDYQRFFNGDAQVPPEEQGDRIRKELTSLIGAPRLSAVDRFRLSGLESRFNSLKELFGRKMREATLSPRASGDGAPADSETAAVLGAGSQADEVESLYRAIYSKRDADVPLADFHDYLARQADRVRERTGCDKVRFTVRSEGGQPKLKARPVKSSSRSRTTSDEA